MINVDASVEKVVNYMSEEWHGGNGGVVLVTDVDEAQGDTEQLALVHDTLGSSSTDYSSSNSNRKQNVRRGAELINGTVLYPGEEFSVEEAVVRSMKRTDMLRRPPTKWATLWKLMAAVSVRYPPPCIWRYFG